MTKRNVGLEIALSLVAAVVLGAGLYLYIDSEIPKPAPINLVPPSERSIATAGASSNNDQMVALAAAWGRQLATGDVVAAQASMAVALREGLSAEQFRERVASNPYLVSAQEISILRTNEQRLGADPAAASFRGTGVLKSKAGAVEVTMHFVREGSDMKILSVLIAGVPALQDTP